MAKRDGVGCWSRNCGDFNVCHWDDGTIIIDCDEIDNYMTFCIFFDFGGLVMEETENWYFLVVETL